MRSLAWIGIVLALFAEQRSPSARELLNAPRAWTTAEGSTIVAAVQRAVTGKTFHLSSVGHSGGPDVLMGRAGRPERIGWKYTVVGGVVGGVVFPDGKSISTVEKRQTVVKLTDYTARSVRRCDGSGLSELVVEYSQESSKRWTATARQRDARDFGGLGIAPLFEMLQGIYPVTSGERKRVRGRWMRAIIASWRPRPTISDPVFLTGDPIPNVAGEPIPKPAFQTLWIDVESLLPWRWEASNHGRVVDAYDFTYRRMHVRLPRGIRPPDCIP